MESRFLDPCDLRVVDDAGARPTFVTLSPMTFFSAARQHEYTVPAGTETDGPSIPVLLAPLIGGTPGLRAAVLHDYLIRSGDVPRETADELFREALHASGVDPNAADTMYRAVATWTASLRPDLTPRDPWDIA